MDPTSDGNDRIDRDRRRALALFGLLATAACLAPVLLKPLPALADGEGGDGDGGDGEDDGHGDDTGDDESSGDSSTKLGSGVPPEAP